jgi:hypothetical protein
MDAEGGPLHLKLGAWFASIPIALSFAFYFLVEPFDGGLWQ